MTMLISNSYIRWMAVKMTFQQRLMYLRLQPARHCGKIPALNAGGIDEVLFLPQITTQSVGLKRNSWQPLQKMLQAKQLGSTLPQPNSFPLHQKHGQTVISLLTLYSRK